VRATGTIDRWVASGILPPPIRINHRRYWDEEALEEREREGMRRRLVGGGTAARA